MAVSFPMRSKRPPQRLEMFEKMAGRIPKYDEDLAFAVDRMVQGYKELSDQSARLNKDATKTDGAKLVALAKIARSKLMPLVEALDTTSASTKERVAALQGRVRLAYDPAGKTIEMCMRHQEIRALFRRMPQGDALRALEAAKAAGDEDTMIALASTQPYLSGLPPQMHEHTRGLLIEAKASVEAAALASLQEQQGLVEIFRAEYLQSVADAVDLARADEIIAAAREDAVA
jgi:hypothetical protein